MEGDERNVRPPPELQPGRTGCGVVGRQRAVRLRETTTGSGDGCQRLASCLDGRCVCTDCLQVVLDLIEIQATLQQSQQAGDELADRAGVIQNERTFAEQFLPCRKNFRLGICTMLLEQ